MRFVPLASRIGSVDGGRIYYYLLTIGRGCPFMTDVTGKIYIDQTSCLSCLLAATSTSSSPTILTPTSSTPNPQKICTGPDLLRSYQTIQKLLEQRGLKLRFHFLNNKFPNILKVFIYEKEKEYQLVSTHIHRRNATEKSHRNL